ncbi:hypothetical protein GCM10011371_16000 [Novosphingobium marinum]|nr:hypothetical protein GCM10011371_16000 [Novosphingobium marinum]
MAIDRPISRIAPDRDKARRMRLTATGLLVAMAAAFIFLNRYSGTHPAWGYVLAFSEAALVGGLADWFAVTALFRHPLGLPIPHTAIIPANKDRIADTMAAFLRSNFLTPQVVARRLHGFNIAASAGAFLTDPARGGESRIRAGAAGLFADILESLDQERLGGMVKAGLRRQIEKIDLAPLLGQMLTNAIADKRHIPVLEAMIRWIGGMIEQNETLIRDMIHERANTIMRWTGLDERLANGVLDGTYRLLAEILVDEHHPLRSKAEEALHGLARDLLEDPEMQARVESWKAEILANPAIGHWLDGMWERSRQALLRTVRDPDKALSGSIGLSLGELGKALSEDRRLQQLINRFSRRTLVGIVSRYGDEIVRIVSETVRRWDAKTVTARIEGAVGRDLQFIRINGTLVGGFVGLCIHGLEKLL